MTKDIGISTARTPGPTGFRRVLGNTVLNLLGNVVPLLTAAVAVPVLVSRLGAGGFGMFSLIWVILGYFSVFDLGLSRALTRLIADFSASGQAAEIPDLVTTALLLLLALGLCGGAVCVAGGLIELHFRGLPAGLAASDVPAMLVILTFGVTATLVVAGIRGILEGFQDFQRANLLRVPAGLLLMGLPALFVLGVPSLIAAVAGLFVARLAVLAMHVAVVLRHYAGLRGRFVPARGGMLFRFGGWLTVSNVIGPVIVYLDRFVLAASMSPSAVGFYVAPFEIVVRLLVVPQALANALFPALTVAQRGDEPHFRRLFLRANLACFLVVFPMAVIAGVLAPWLIRNWLGAQFALESSTVMRILLAGFVFNAMAQLPLTALYSRGRARPVAILHMAELPLYLLALTALVHAFGLTGAATAWALRSAADCGCLFLLARILGTERNVDGTLLETST